MLVALKKRLPTFCVIKQIREKRSKIRESYKVNLQHYEKKTINSIILRRSGYDEL